LFQGRATNRPAGASLAAPKITDFGLARQLDRDAAQSRSGGVTGTLAYMAPEQACCRNDLLGAPTDVYSLGAILYEALTGRPPFTGETPYDVIIQVTTQDPEPPRRLRARTPRDLETICLKCLEKAPARRYASALELAEDLRRFIAHEPILARPAGTAERAVKWVRRRPTTAALLTVCLLAVLGLATAAVLYTRAQWSRIAAAHDEVHELLTGARAAGENDSWEKSRDQAAAALAKIKAEPALAAEFQKDAARLLDRATQRLGADVVLRRFLDLRDDALFHASLATGEGSARNMEAAQARANEALALVGAADLSGVPWTSDGAFTEKDKNEVVRGCYELLLVLAEVEGQPKLHGEGDKSRQAENALNVLARTRGLGLETHAYHLRRARYLREAGRKKEADEELAAAEKRPPRDALDFFLVGDELYKDGAPEKAAKAFVSALLLQPDHFWARYFLALCYTRQRQYPAARDSLTTCLGKRPDFVWTYLLRGFVHGQLQDYADADADFARAEELLKADPDLDARYVLLNNSGVLSVGRKQFAEAVRDLNEAVRLKPDQYQAYVSLSQAYRLQNDMNGASRELDRAVTAAERLVQAGDIDPGTLALLYRNRSRLHLERGEEKEAVADLQRAVKQLADDPSARAHTLAEMGRVLQHDHDYEAGLTAFEAAAQILPREENAQRGRAQTLFRLKRYAEAVEALDQFFQQGGTATAQLYQARALAKVKLTHNEDAVSDFTLALERTPNDVALRTQRGQTYLACQAPQLALLDFKAAIRLDPKHAPAYQGRGLARLQLDKAQDAAGDAESLVRLAAGDARLVYAAAGILAQSAARLELQEERGGRERPTFRVHCQERAETLLREAMRLLPEGERAAFWRDVARRDGAPAPLRRSNAYTELDRQYGSDKGE
jgi:eukaryotic-like serine/threonine-protein kinase